MNKIIKIKLQANYSDGLVKMEKVTDLINNENDTFKN
jgi:hypothetical protein